MRTVFYMRAGNKARLFYKYSDKEHGIVEKLGKSNKSREQEVIIIPRYINQRIL